MASIPAERAEKPPDRLRAGWGGVRNCGKCVACQAGLEPASREHFQVWTSVLRLDSGDLWGIEVFQLDISEDVFAGFREVWGILPEGQAKTTLFAAIALYHGEHVMSPWVPIGAAARDQAEIMFGQAAGFVERAVEDKVWAPGYFRVYEGYRKIKCPTGGRGIKVYAADAKTGDGVIPTLALVDELHRHDDLRLYRLWKGKLGKRGGQIATISTAGEPGAEFEEQRETIRNKAITRKRDGCHLRAEGKNLVYHEWMVPDAKKARDLVLVKEANPLSTISIEYLQEKLESETLDYGEDWLRLTCNIPTRSSLAAVPEADWDALETNEEIPEGVPIACGADFAWLVDTTAIVPLWVKSTEFRLFGEPHILTPPRDGTILDIGEVKEAFQTIHDRNPIEMVVMDMSRAEDVAQWLENELGVQVVVDRTQAPSEAVEDYDAWMEAMRGGWIRHGGHREFRRHVLNAIARRMPGDKHRFDRPSTSRNTRASRQERRVIDALTAAGMVHCVAAGNLTTGDPMFDWSTVAGAAA